MPTTPATTGRSATVMALGVLSLVLLALPIATHKPGLPATLKADEPAYYLAAESLWRDLDLRCDAQDLERLFESYPFLPVQNLILMSNDGWNTLYFGKPYLYSLVGVPFVAAFGANGLVVLNMALLLAMLWGGFFFLRALPVGGRGEQTLSVGSARPQAARDGPAALFAVGFFLLGLPYVYVYWLHPEVFNMASTFGCLFFGLGAHRTVPGWLGRRSRVWALAASAGFLAAGVYNKPMLAAFGVPVLIDLARRAGSARAASTSSRAPLATLVREAAVWLGVSVGAMALFAGLSLALTGQPTAYLVELRAGVPVHDPGRPPIIPIPVPGGEAPIGEAAPGEAAVGETIQTQAPESVGRAPATALETRAPVQVEGVEGEAVQDEAAQVEAVQVEAVAPAPANLASGASGDALDDAALEDSDDDEAQGAGWGWLIRIPETTRGELAEAAGSFWMGRHTGLVVYQPFAAFAVLWFFVFGWRDLRRWTIFLSACAVAFFFLAFINFNWHGGGGFVGNRYFVMATPALLFLLPRVPVVPLVPLYAVAGLLLGPILLSPYGQVVPSPTLQSHVRGPAFAAFPIELSLREIPGYDGVVQADTWLWGRKDEARRVDDDRLWLRGGDAGVWILSTAPLRRPVFELSALAASQTAQLCLGEDCRTLEVPRLGEGMPLGTVTDPVRLTLEPGPPDRVRQQRDPTNYWQFFPVYVYRLHLETERGIVPRWLGEPGPTAYRGAELRYLGEAEALEDAALGSTGRQASASVSE